LHAGLPVGSFVCCGHNFKNRGALERHMIAKHNKDPQQVPAPPKRRGSYTLKSKVDALTFVRWALTIMCVACGKFSPQDGVYMPAGVAGTCFCGQVGCGSFYSTVSQCAGHLRVPNSTLGKWIHKAEKFEALKFTSLKRYKRLGSGRYPQFMKAEQELFDRYVFEYLILSLISIILQVHVHTNGRRRASGYLLASLSHEANIGSSRLSQVQFFKRMGD